MIIDSLTFLGHSFSGPSATAEEIVAYLDDVGVDRAIVCPFKPPTYNLQEANDAVGDAVRSHPGRLIGFARLDPWQGSEAVVELERATGELGLRGIFLHPWEETFPIADHALDPILTVASQRELPVLVAAGYPWVSEALQIGDLAARFPLVQFIASNGGQINISGLGTYDAEFALAGHMNLAMQTAGVYRQDFLEEMVARFGADRLLYASAFPLMEPRLEILRVTTGRFTTDQQKAMLSGGASARIRIG